MLIKPTPDIISTYAKRFENEEYGSTDKAISKLFRIFPYNNQLDEVLLKVAAVNNLYNTNIYAVFDVARHIWRIDIDTQLEQKSLDLVDAIAKVKIKGKTRRNYSFASKYCSFHAPDIYPIYDSYVNQVLWAYKNADMFSDFNRSELQDYPRYKEIIEQFRNYYGLAQFSLKEIDKFLWLYGIESYR
jgi:hypothetical protein